MSFEIAVETPMKNQTYGISQKPHQGMHNSHGHAGPGNPLRYQPGQSCGKCGNCSTYGNARKVEALVAYKAARVNGKDCDNPSWGFPNDGNYAWEGHEHWGCAVRYTEGTRDRAWMQERDKNYQRRLDFSKKIREKSVDGSGNTALHLAVIGGHIEIVKYIITNKCLNIMQVNKANKTAYNLAVELRKTEIVSYLKGVDVIMQTLSEIENLKKVNTEQQNKIQTLQQELQQVKDRNQELQNKQIQRNQTNRRLPLPTSSKSFQLNMETKAAIATTFFIVGLILTIEGKEILNEDEFKLVGKSIIALFCIALVTIITRQVVKISENATYALIAIQKRAGLLSEGLTEVVINSANSLKVLNNAVIEVKDVLNQLENKTSNAINAFVQLKDETVDALVEFRGHASDVAKAIREGIENGRFTPKAKVNADISFNVKPELKVKPKFSVLSGPF